MKIMNKLLVLAGLAAVLLINVDCFAKKRVRTRIQANTQAAPSEPVVVEATEEVKAATAQAQVTIADAEQKIAAFRKQLETGDISPVDASKNIGELNYAIEQAKKQLAEFTSEKVKEVEAAQAQEEGYVSRFVSGVKDFGARIAAPFKSGYGYSEKEKTIARAIIAELQDQLKSIEEGYAIAKKQATTTDQKNQIMRDYDPIIQQIREEIRNQQVITGEVMSRNRKLFWASVGTAGALAAGAAARSYLATGTEENNGTQELILSSIKNVPGDAEQAGEYFAKEYGAASTQAISRGLERAGQEISASSVPSGAEEAGEYFAETYGAPATQVINRGLERVGQEISASSVPSDAEEAGEYFAETYGAPATQAISRGLERAGQEISASSVPSDAEEAGEYFAETYGAPATEAINKGLDQAGEAISQAYESETAQAIREKAAEAGETIQRVGKTAAAKAAEAYEGMKSKASELISTETDETVSIEPTEPIVEQETILPAEDRAITEEMASNRQAAQERLRAAQERKSQQQRRQPTGWQ
jgi:hypothetical protein